MPTIDVRTATGATSGSVELDDSMFGVEPHVSVLHQVVTAQLAAARRGTQSTKTRSEVSGGGAKPFRQKGTGRARQGSTRAPHWSGGGIALGPKPRSYTQRTPKKMIRLALASALSDRAAEGRVIVVDEWGFEAPKTSNAIAALRALGIEGRVLVVVSPEDDNAIKSFRNLPEVQLIFTGELNAYDVLCNEWIVFTSDVVPAGRPASVRAGQGETAAPAKTAPRKPAPFSAAGPTATPQPTPSPVHDAEPAEGDAAAVDEAIAASEADTTAQTTEEAGE